MYDVNSDVLAKSLDILRNDLNELVATNSARTSLSVDDRMKLITTVSTLEECISDVIHIQECAFEDVPMKQGIFKQIDDLLDEANTSTIIASSTSFCMPSILFKDVTKHIDQCLVAHPVNPPLLVRLVEIVCQSKTRPDIANKARELMSGVGQKPVVLHKEVGGFAVNVIQSAILHQAFSLINDGIISVEDIDTVMSEGLGARYAFIGPWMVAHLNATGMEEYFQKYSNGLYSITSERPVLRMEGETAKKIIDSLNSQVPIDRLPEKRAWRDRCLKELDDVKSKLN